MKKIIKKAWLKSLFLKIKRDVTTKKKQSIALVIVCVAVGVYLGLNAGLLWFLFLSFAVYDWDNRIIGGMALVCLTMCPFLIQFKYDDIAEQVAVCAYFFLVMTVTLQIIEYKRHPELYDENEHEEKH